MYSNLILYVYLVPRYFFSHFPFPFPLFSNVLVFNNSRFNRFVSGPLPISLPRLGESLVCSNSGAVMRAVTVGKPYTLFWDSALKWRNATKDYEMRPGLSKEVWDYITQRTGLKEVFMDPAPTWGSAEVRGLSQSSCKLNAVGFFVFTKYFCLKITGGRSNDLWTHYPDH